MRGLLRGYVQILCVREDCRRQGLGFALLRWAEELIFRESPNVFICVSSFNAGARRLDERLGFELVGRFESYSFQDTMNCSFARPEGLGKVIKRRQPNRLLHLATGARPRVRLALDVSLTRACAGERRCIAVQGHASAWELAANGGMPRCASTPFTVDMGRVGQAASALLAQTMETWIMEPQTKHSQVDRQIL